MVPDFLAGIPQIQAGKVIPLAAVMRERSPLLPDVPTFNETVIRDFEVLPWSGLFGPAGLPADIVKQLSDASAKVVGSAETVKKINTMGIELFYLGADKFPAYVKDDMPVWHAHAKTAGIDPQ